MTQYGRLIGLLGLAVVAAAGSGAVPATAEPSLPSGTTLWLEGGAGLLKVRVFEGAARGESAPLVVFLHDDAPFQPPVFNERFARAVAERRPETVAAALLRPGYTDLTGDRSAGERAAGDGYTAEAAAAVATAVRALARRYGSGEVLLVGQAGGAALAAVVLGTAPGTAGRALLLACPCDLNAWRRHLAVVSPRAGWREPPHSLSPLALVPRLRRDLVVRLLVSAGDPVTPPRLSEAYQRALAARGLDARLTVLPGSRHDLLFEPAVFAALDELLDAGR